MDRYPDLHNLSVGRFGQGEQVYALALFVRAVAAREGLRCA